MISVSCIAKSKCSELIQFSLGLTGVLVLCCCVQDSYRLQVLTSRDFDGDSGYVDLSPLT